MLHHYASKCCRGTVDDVFFFFSSRRRHTRCYRDWSSDVCSSDLFEMKGAPTIAVAPFISKRSSPFPMRITKPGKRSEERRVGKEGRYRRAAEPTKKKVDGVLGMEAVN